MEASLEALRARHPWPDERPAVRSVHWCLDGGGRQLVTELISRRGARVVLEVGAFLGGSVRRWLDHDPGVVVVAVDAWSGAWWGDYARRRGEAAIGAQLDAPDGPYQTFLATNWAFRDRLVAVRGTSPEVLHEIAATGLRPELVYLDSDKGGDELPLFGTLFPDAVVCGDDWAWGTDRWRDVDAGYPIRGPVRRFAAERGLHLRTHRQTWVADPDPPGVRDRLRQRLVDLRMTWRRVRSFGHMLWYWLAPRATHKRVAGPE